MKFTSKFFSILSQCAARRTRHRAFYFGGGAQVGELKNKPKRNSKTIAKKWLQTSGRTPKATKNPSKNLEKSLKVGSGTIPGALGGGSGTSLAPGRPRARKGHQKAAKTHSVFSIKMGTRSNFSQVFFSVFWGARVACFSWFWVPEDLILSILAILWGHFFRSWLWVRFGDFFSVFYDF